MHNIDFGHLLVPVVRDGFEDEPELDVVAGFDGGGADGFGVDVGLAGADEREREAFDLWGEADIVAEDDLESGSGEGGGADILDVAVEEGGFASGEAGGLAHGEFGEDERLRVAVSGKDGVGGFDGRLKQTIPKRRPRFDGSSGGAEKMASSLAELPSAGEPG
jgi:hypothetical protein